MSTPKEKKRNRDAAPREGGVALTRSSEDGIVGGVLAGLSYRLAVDPLLLRIGFVLLVLLTGGLALIAYVVGWVAIPAEGEPGGGWLGVAPGGWKVAGGAALLALAALLVFRELGIWWSDALVWPLVLAAAGAALLWRQTESPWRRDRPETPRPRETRPRAAAQPAGERATPRTLYRGGFGIALVIGAAILFLYANGAFEAASDAILAAVVAIVALGLILAPFLWRLGRNLAAERAARIRTQERAEVGAHLHDSVLQTLALVQKRADDPREVANLARRQERELRAWLGGRNASNGDGVAASLERAAAEVEDAHGVPVDAVIVGDAPLDDRAEAVVAAAREAMVNAAKFAPDAGPVALYGEFEDGRASVYVRDRGPGFERESIPADRHGVRESIMGRMSRHGGTAQIRTAPGEGTEVRLEIPVGRDQ